MNTHGEHTPISTTDSGIALKLPGGEAMLPVSAAGCLALARAVTAGIRTGGERVGDPLAWAVAAEDPAVAGWLAAERLSPELPGSGSGAEPYAIAGRLRDAVVATPTPAGAENTAGPGGLLLAILAAADAHHALAARFEERVAEARLEALRELAYGAGHEINNPLANIAARAQALLLDEREPERRRRLATIVDQAFRARDMIGGLMLFARPPRAQPAATTVAEMLRPVVEAVATRATARQIRLEYSPPPCPVGIYVDATQVGEAVRLLATNAIEAVDDGGRVHVEATIGPAASRARIVVGDDGPGMDSDTAARACDPFFSGREAGRGIGLGLPKARRLIEASGGNLMIESRPGRGTRCIVDLPALPPAA